MYVELIFLLMQLICGSYFLYKLSRINVDFFCCLIPFQYLYLGLYLLPIESIYISLPVIEISFIWLVVCISDISLLSLDDFYGEEYEDDEEDKEDESDEDEDDDVYDVYDVYDYENHVNGEDGEDDEEDEINENDEDNDEEGEDDEEEEIEENDNNDESNDEDDQMYFSHEIKKAFSKILKRILKRLSRPKKVVFILLLIQILLTSYFKMYTIHIDQVIFFILLGFINFICGFHKKDTFVEKVFENYVILPRELQMMIIDEMEPIDRCRFTRCSRISNIQAKRSTNYIAGLEIILSDNYKRISVIHKSNERTFDRGFALRFREKLGNKYMYCESIRGKKQWSNQLDDSTDLNQYAIEQFKNLLQLHQNQIKKLDISIRTTQPNNIDFGIKSLRNLEELVIHYDTDILQFLSKTTKKLRVIETRKVRNLANCEQIYEVQQEIDSPNTKLNKEQFLRLSASEVTINIGFLTEYDIFNFIRSWQKGTIGKEILSYQWFITNSSFDLGRLFRLIGVDKFHSNSQHEIRHEITPEVSFMLSVHEYYSDSWILSFMETSAFLD